MFVVIIVKASERGVYHYSIASNSAILSDGPLTNPLCPGNFRCDFSAPGWLPGLPIGRLASNHHL
jgi:hypothetical protein